MTCRRLAVVLLVGLFAFGGCVARLPTRAEVAASEQAFAKLSDRPVQPLNVPLADYAAARTVLLIDGPNWTVVRRADGSATFRTPGDSASAAVAITSDGYLLTSAHGVSGQRVLAVLPGWDEPGHPVRLRRARVVWSGENANPPVDAAILKVDLAENDEPMLHLSPERVAADVPEASTPVLLTGVAPDIGRGDRPPPLANAAGRVVATRVVFNATLVAVDAPVRPGFSGGPALAADGRLVGITVQLSAKSRLYGVFPFLRVGPQFTTRLVRLDPQFVRGVIQRDRLLLEGEG